MLTLLFYAIIMWSCKKPRWVADANCCLEIILLGQPKFEIVLSGQPEIDRMLQSPASTSWVFYETSLALLYHKFQASHFCSLSITGRWHCISFPNNHQRRGATIRHFSAFLHDFFIQVLQYAELTGDFNPVHLGDGRGETLHLMIIYWKTKVMV